MESWEWEAWRTHAQSAPIGGPDVAYNQSTTDLAPGDTLLLMTDGYFELFNEEDEILDLPNVKKFFAECAHQSPEEIIDYLVEKGKEWSKNRPQNDDITFVVAKVKWICVISY